MGNKSTLMGDASAWLGMMSCMWRHQRCIKALPGSSLSP
jgi:hypothetical protein